MLDISCPGVYPGVILWPISHPYIKALAPYRAENAPLTARLSKLFYLIFQSGQYISATDFYESMGQGMVGLPHVRSSS